MTTNQNTFLEIMTDDGALRDLGAAPRGEVQRLFGRDAARMVGYSQNNPHHCYDLMTHTLKVVQGIRREQFLGYDVFATARAAAFFHDIGKPSTARPKNNRTVFYGHAEKSAQIALPILEDMGFASKQTRRITILIAHHDDFISYRLPGERVNRRFGAVISKKAVNDARHKLRIASEDAGAEGDALWASLLALCRADAAAQANETWMDGRLVDTRQNKLRRIEAIRSFSRP